MCMRFPYIIVCITNINILYHLHDYEIFVCGVCERVNCSKKEKQNDNNEWSMK